MNEKILQIIAQQRAIRTYSNQPISDEDWQVLLEVARASASSNGLEPWRILQVDSADLRAEVLPFSRGMEKQLRTAPKLIYFIGKKIEKKEEWAEAQLKLVQAYPDEIFDGWKERFKYLQENMLTIDKEAWNERQMTIPAAQMALAAGFLGIDYCLMEGFDYHNVGQILAKCGAFNPDTEQLGIAVSFGYRQENPKRPKMRRAMNDIIDII
ncbi:MAG: nitroreductase family protein [Lactococcus sp.]